MAREAELDEIKKSIDKAGRFDVKRAVKDMVDPEDEFDRAFEIDDGMKKAKPVSNVQPKSIAKPPAGERDSAPAAAPTTATAETSDKQPAATVDEAASSRG
jgi:hypothetical protein